MLSKKNNAILMEAVKVPHFKLWDLNHTLLSMLSRFSESQKQHSNVWYSTVRFIKMAKASKLINENFPLKKTSGFAGVYMKNLIFLTYLIMQIEVFSEFKIAVYCVSPFTFTVKSPLIPELM